ASEKDLLLHLTQSVRKMCNHNRLQIVLSGTAAQVRPSTGGVRMGRTRRQADAKSLLIATAVATLVYGGAIGGGRRVPAAVDPAAAARHFAAPATAPRTDDAAARAVKATRKLALAPLDQAEAAVLAQVKAGAFPGAALAVGRQDQTVLE